MNWNNKVTLMYEEVSNKLRKDWPNWKERATPMKATALLAAGALVGTMTALMPSPTAPISPIPSTATQSISTQSQEVPTTQQPAATLANQVRTHIVVAGETLYGIAGKYQIDVDTLLSANPEIRDIIRPGDQLTVLPQRGQLHVVETGDTLWGLASQYDVTADRILKANNKQDERLYIGEKLFVPGGRHRAVTAVSRAAVSRFIWPAAGELTSPYGYRWGRLHAGIDIANDIGTPIRAARSGRIVFAGWESGYGYTIIIDHGNEYSSLYGHLNGFAVSPGQYVQTGQFIAYMGDTGNSTGPHLHFEVRMNGKAVNPANYLQ